MPIPKINSSSSNGKEYYPELLLCICAAMGTDNEAVTDALASEIRAVGYTPYPIRLSSLMSQIPGLDYLAQLTHEDERIRESIKAGNEIRRVVGNADAMARLALSEIHRVRASLNESKDVYVPAERHCFIISSLKREEEIETLRALFGQRVFLVSVYDPCELRLENLCRRIASSRRSSDPEAHKNVAEQLIEVDLKESSTDNGQRLEDVFQLGDVFLRAGTGLRQDARRFIQLLFRAPYVTPTVDELLMFHARGAAQRSADLSRQVGAVLATNTGEILASGCNEVPRAGGGILWDDVAGTEHDYRDYKVGHDSAASTRKELVAELLVALREADWLVETKQKHTPDELAEDALFTDPKPLKGTLVASLLEFGRIVHAEMAAICDAALRGVRIKGGTLYCTTFPCHMCARHIIAAGIERVVYIEPYPKSRAKKLYKRAIQVDHDRMSDDDAVKFESFVGVAPRRFLDLFKMVTRKDEQGYSLKIAAPSGAPKATTFGSLVSELESSYVQVIKTTDWGKLKVEKGT